jgi:hypothetical protein
MHSQFEAAHMKSSSALASAAAMAQQAQTNLRSIQQQQQQYSDSLASSSSSTTTQVPQFFSFNTDYLPQNDTAASDHSVFFLVPHVLASRVVHVVASSQHGGEARMKSLASKYCLPEFCFDVPGRYWRARLDAPAGACCPSRDAAYAEAF